ncbi:MAG: TrmH family RNA methyltransferase [Candidatus Microsaccharimonas sp.]
MEPDTRNVVDKYRHQPVEAIKADLDTTRSELEIAIENLERDFNMGTIVRTANAFNVRKIHVIGRRQWNKRGAMVTDAYMHIEYHPTVAEFVAAVKQDGRTIISMDIVDGAQDLSKYAMPLKSVLVFGAEGPGISEELQKVSDVVVQIEQFGSTRSINVGVAAGIAMYTWVQQHLLTR